MEKCCTPLDGEIQCYEEIGMACPMLTPGCYSHLEENEDTVELVDKTKSVGGNATIKCPQDKEGNENMTTDDENVLTAAYVHFALDILAIIIYINNIIRKRFFVDPLGSMINDPFVKCCGFEVIEPPN